MANVNTPVFGYPQPWGSKYQMMWDHTGPASYNNIGTTGGANAGDIIRASDLGFGGIDQVSGAFGGFTEFYTASGNYLVKMFTGNTTTTPTVVYPVGSAFSQIVLQWFTTAAPFGAISTEVTNATNLSAETLRLFATMV
jgi:hypothetical protein